MVDDSHDTIVVLLPGLWMPAWVMLAMERKLARAGYRCVRFGYASARAGLDENSQRLAAFIRDLGAARVHVVGHSLGGVLALHATVTHGLSAVRRIVLVGSPYSDCCVARKMSRRAFGRWMLGKTLPDWLARPRPAVPPGIEVGVIAGTVAFGLGMLVVPEMAPPHDGVVRAEETPVQGMSAYTEAYVSHAGILLSSRVACLVEHFLSHGRFEAIGQTAPASDGEKRYAFGPRREP